MKKSILRGFAGKLMIGSALAALAATSALAQDESVTITGTSIRGQVPVGANVISVDREAITAQGAQTAQQLLANVPQLAGFGNAAQGAIGSFDGAGTQAPTIHSLGASASNTTLVLINGHRIPLSGLNHTLADPSIIPAAAIQRVEILPDGASSIYGSDAMAGVINFITRKDYSGWETSGQYGFGDGYSTANFSQLFGHSWDTGAVLAVYNYSNRSRLNNVDRDFITARQDLRHGSAVVGSPTYNGNTGGANFNDFNCGPATIAQTSGTPAVFEYPYTGSSISTATAAQAGICNRVDAISVLPGEVRNSALVSIRQALGDSINVSADLVYSTRLGSSAQARGTLNASAFSPTAVAGVGGVAATFSTNQRNPFYLSGSTGFTSTQFVRYDFEQLLGHGAYTKNGSNDVMATLGLDMDLGGGWAGSLGSTFGTNLAQQRAYGQVNQAEALLALNGTQNAGGNPTASTLADPYGLGTVVMVTRALTTANALDVWRPGAANLTSASVRRSLTDSATNLTTHQSLRDVVIKFDGPVMDLPAGTIKAAFGGEYIHHTINQRNSTPNSLGPNSTSSRALSLDSNRTIYAAFAEFVIPVISEDMGIPLVQKLDFNVSGRYDHYSDVGDTKNPKLGLTWNIVNGLKARATYGTSFTAPALTSSGQPGTGITAETSIASDVNAGVGNNTVIPYTWAGIAGTWVADPVTCAANGGTATAGGCQINTAITPGITINGGSAAIKPQTGLSYSAGIDLDAGSFFDLLSGLTVNVTYWQAKYLGLITAPAFSLTPPFPTLQTRSTFAPPGGWLPTDPAVTAVTTGRPLNASLPARIWHIYDFTQGNVVNLQANGIDWGVHYILPMDDMGTFTFSNDGGLKLRFDQNNGPSTAPWTKFLNGTNRSTTFNSIAWTMRTTLGWNMDPWSVQFSWNFVNAYHNSNNNPPYNLAAPNGHRTAGREHVGAHNTFDLNVGFDIPEDILSGSLLSVTVTNLLDKDPPYATGGVGGFPGFNGFDGGNAANGNPIGRVVTVGVTKKW